VALATIEAYLHNLCHARPDFVYSVSREFVRGCQTPMLVMSDDALAYAYQTSVDVAALAPRAQAMVFPWREPPELKARTIEQMREFLRASLPVRAAAP
jgi:hypothetical protein